MTTLTSPDHISEPAMWAADPQLPDVNQISPSTMIALPHPIVHPRHEKRKGSAPRKETAWAGSDDLGREARGRMGNSLLPSSCESFGGRRTPPPT